MLDEEGVRVIRDWLMRQPHLPQTLEDHFLDNFLLCCDGSLEQTKTALQLFFSYRTTCCEIFSDRDPLKPQIQHIFKIIELCPLPQLTPEGYGCLVFRFCDADPDQFQFYDFVKLFFMVGDVRVRHETQVVRGLVPILDMSGWSLRHLAKCPLLAVRKYLKYCQEAQPVKLRQIHVVNATPLFDKLFSVIKPFVKTEVVSAVNIHPVGSQSLYEFVPRSILPKEYGGLAGTMKEIHEDYKRKVEVEREWFLKDEWMMDASKRSDQDFSSEAGSFRALSID